MKIYFSAAIVQKEQFGPAYEEIVAALTELGHTVFQDTTTVSLQDAITKSDDDRVAYYKQVVQWISQSDVVVLEVSFPSTLHIGHEISLALEKGKPVVALYQRGFEPSFFLGKEDDRLFWSDYQPGDLKKSLAFLLDSAVDLSDTRFNFFISPRHIAYLDWIVQHKKIPRSVYLRQLIEADREVNKKYSVV